MTLLEKNNGLDKVTSTIVRRQYTEVSRLVHAMPKPIEVTVNGKADLILMKPALFEALMELLEEYEDMESVLAYEASKTPDSWVDASEVLKDIDSGDYKSMPIDELLNQ